MYLASLLCLLFAWGFYLTQSQNAEFDFGPRPTPRPKSTAQPPTQDTPTKGTGALDMFTETRDMLKVFQVT